MEDDFPNLPLILFKMTILSLQKNLVRLGDSASVGGKHQNQKQPISAKSVLFEKVPFFGCFLSFVF